MKEIRGWLPKDHPHYGRQCEYELTDGSLCGKPSVYHSITDGPNFGFACQEHAEKIATYEDTICGCLAIS